MTYEGCNVFVHVYIPHVKCFKTHSHKNQPVNDVLITAIVTGHMAKNGKQGEGIMNKDGEIYTGGWSKNLRHGQGKCCYKNGDVYEGRWVGGKRCGRGRFISKDGSVYVGLWVDGRQHDKGELWVCGPCACHVVTRPLPATLAIISRFDKLS